MEERSSISQSLIIKLEPLSVIVPEIDFSCLINMPVRIFGKVGRSFENYMLGVQCVRKLSR